MVFKGTQPHDAECCVFFWGEGVALWIGLQTYTTPMRQTHGASVPGAAHTLALSRQPRLVELGGQVFGSLRAIWFSRSSSRSLLLFFLYFFSPPLFSTNQAKKVYFFAGF